MTAQSHPGDLFQLDEEHHLLRYRGYRFEYGVQRTSSGLYKPLARHLADSQGNGDFLLPDDTEEIAYATEAEAERHAQQQVLRWVNDRTGQRHSQG